MRASMLFLAAAWAGCGTRPPVAVTEMPGNYLDVATCVMSQFRASEPGMVFAADRTKARADLWEDYPEHGLGGRKFYVSFSQARENAVAVEVRDAGPSIFEEQRFLGRLREALTGCPTEPPNAPPHDGPRR
jgi:hypothetical protein